MHPGCADDEALMDTGSDGAVLQVVISCEVCVSSGAPFQGSKDDIALDYYMTR